MKNVWSRLKMGSENDPDQKYLTNWIGEQDRTSGAQENEVEDRGQTETYVDNRPIEPQEHWKVSGCSAFSREN
jgi:hypothetical protein